MSTQTPEQAENASTTVKEKNNIADYFLYAGAALAFTGAALRVFCPAFLNRVDSSTLLYLGVAGAFILAREIKSLSIGDYKVEFERTRKVAEQANINAEDAKRVANDAQTNCIGDSGGKHSLPAPKSGSAVKERKPEAAPSVLSFGITPGTESDDPWNGAFGKTSKSNGRELRATVTDKKGIPDWYTINLSVISTDAAKPLSGRVQFFLHPTFKNDRPRVTVGANGRAELELTAWGAFTVGVLTEDGVKLELDLAQLQSAPETFRGR